MNRIPSQVEPDATVARSRTTPISTYIGDFLIAAEGGTHVRRPLTKLTLNAYRKALRELDALLGSPTLATFTLERVAAVVTEKRRTSASNARLIAAVAKSFSRWLHRAGYAKTHVLDQLAVPAFNARRRGFTDAELRTILRALTTLPNRTRKRDRALVLFALGSGCRSNELRTLTIGDVHIAKPLADSWAQIRWDNAKSKRGRQVRIAEDAAAAIHDYIAADRLETEPGAPLFLSEEGARYSYDGWGNMWSRIADRLEEFGVKDFGAHRCRHEWATLGARAKMTQAELEQEGGWERGSKVPAAYIDEIPFEEMQKRASPMTAFLRRAS